MEKSNCEEICSAPLGLLDEKLTRLAVKFIIAAAPVLEEITNIKDVDGMRICTPYCDVILKTKQ